MRRSAVAVAIWLLCAITLAVEPARRRLPVRVVCPPIEETIEYEGFIPALIVVGKLQAGTELVPPSDWRRHLNHEETDEDRQHRLDTQRSWNLVVEEVLFGSPPRERIIPLQQRFNREPGD